MYLVSDARSRIGVIANGYIYLDNAGAGPLPVDTVEAVMNYVEKWYSNGEPWIEGLEALERSKHRFAELINASYHEVAAFPGLTYGLNTLLSSLKIPRGSNIIATDLNFPTSLYTLHAMKRSGLVSEVRIIKSRDGIVSLSDIEKVIDDKTYALVIDHVSWISGYKFDIREISKIAHEKGALVIVDGFHAVGVIPVNVKYLDVDMYLTGTYKWLMSLHGGGFGYVKSEFLEDLTPSYSGWFAIEDSPTHRMRLYGEEMFREPFNIDDLRLSKSASKLEWGTNPLTIFVGVEASLNFIMKYDAPGKYNIHTEYLVRKLMRGLEELGCKVLTPEESKAAIVVFESRDPYYVQEKMFEKRIVVSARPGIVRISPHFYNSVEDINAVLQTLSELKIC